MKVGTWEGGKVGREGGEGKEGLCFVFVVLLYLLCSASVCSASVCSDRS